LISDTDKAYAAGWFEGRGYIRIGCQKGRTPRLTVYIHAPYNQNDWFMQRWGGKTTVQRTNVKVYGNSSQLSGQLWRQAGGGIPWTIDRLLAKQFLEDILPYLTTRQRFAQLSYEFLERVVDRGEKSSDDLIALVELIRRTGRERT
jgi:hypothetical protein